ncbi:natural cytotoxicity triggering receptor 2-like [Trichosurus vulpecula]|uniref:natural cytotoxicity triggering receptor 2-like n=1 Tax=Trichosurus vulpecula TaxID=9337 RepID=UPI00186B3373|nr:natural cytotoxicity triggering receptor 2-like [Trichosurus vulpecula]
MMTQAAPLLLLLPLLLMGSQGQVSQLKYQEGQTLRVRCGYNPQGTEKNWKTWCKLRENGRVCDRIITKKLQSFMLPFMESRASLEDDTSTGTITITMSNLRVGDSGNYQCGIYDSDKDTIDVIRTIRVEVSRGKSRPTHTQHSQSTTEMPLTTSAISLATSSPPHSSIFFSSSVIGVLCGLIVTKGVVFTVLIALLGSCRHPGKGRSQSELSQDQNDRK